MVGHRSGGLSILCSMALTFDPDQPMTISVVLHIGAPPAEDLADQLRAVWDLAMPMDSAVDGGILIGEGETELAGIGCAIRIETDSEGITIVDLRGLAPIGVDRWPVAGELAAPVRDAALARIVPSLVAPDDVTVAYSDISLFSG